MPEDDEKEEKGQYQMPEEEEQYQMPEDEPQLTYQMPEDEPQQEPDVYKISSSQIFQGTTESQIKSSNEKSEVVSKSSKFVNRIRQPFLFEPDE